MLLTFQILFVYTVGTPHVWFYEFAVFTNSLNASDWLACSYRENNAYPRTLVLLIVVPVPAHGLGGSTEHINRFVDVGVTQFRAPGEIKRREVELDPQVSPEQIMSREVELGCESWTSFASGCSSTAVQRTLSL